MSPTIENIAAPDYYSMCGTNLPADYEPCENTVIIGRGRKAHGHEGNIRFQTILKAYREKYERAASRAEKTNVIVQVIQKVKGKCSDGIGFVKKNQSSGKWLGLQSISARTSVGQAFRDLLKGKYKSSKHFKQAMRDLERQHPEQDFIGQAYTNGTLTDVSFPFTLLNSMRLSPNLAPLPPFRRLVSVEAPCQAHPSTPAQVDQQESLAGGSWVDSLCALLPLEDQHVKDNTSNPYEPLPLQEQDKTPVKNFSSMMKTSLVLDDQPSQIAQTTFRLEF